jgi:hypothetical protein
MATDIQLSQLIINKLTKAQFNEAKAAGLISDNELYMITDDEAGGCEVVTGSYEGYDGYASITTYPNIPAILLVSGGGNFAFLDINSGNGVCFSSSGGLQHVNVTYSDYSVSFNDQNGLNLLSMPGITYYYLYTVQ